MNIIEYFKNSFRRKYARRYTKEYPAVITTYNLKNEGQIEFANWDNPLMPNIEINQNYVDFFRKFIREGDLVIDIGANIGDTTILMALVAGNKGLTLAFDPNPLAFKILEVNATLNKEKVNIVPVPYAITVEEETFYYVSSEASFTNGGISKTKESRHGKFVYPEKIKGVNLMSYLETKHQDKLDQLTFIKIDAEGYDKEIIKSISDLMLAYKPVIVAESFSKSSDEEKMELYDVIKRLNYNIFYFEDFTVDAKIIKLENREDLTKWKETINIYATPGD